MYSKNYYKRNLPHWQPTEAEYFVTFRLNGSLPKPVVKKLKLQQEEIANDTEGKAHEDSFKLNKQNKIFEKYESLLDSGATGPTWLANSGIAELVKEAIRHRDKKVYDLYAYCIMPNHVHLVFKLLATLKNDMEFPVTHILKGLKSFTALKANRELGKTGPFWQSESYDRVIRNANELENVVRYVLTNPKKAGLTEDWRQWPHSYCKNIFLSTFE